MVAAKVMYAEYEGESLPDLCNQENNIVKPAVLYNQID